MKAQDTFLDQQKQNETKQAANQHFVEGNDKYRQNKYDDAIIAYSHAISLQLTTVEFYFARARCYFVKRDYHKYVFDLSLAMHVESTNYALYIARSHGLFMLGHYNQALIDLNSAKQLFDDYTKQEEQRQKESNLKHINRTSTTQVYATISYRRGVTNFQLKNWRDAIEDFTDTLTIWESFAPAYSRRGAAYLKLKKGNEAIADLKLAVQKSNINQHLHHYRLGQAYLEVVNNQQAVESFTNAIESSSHLIREKVKKNVVVVPPSESIFINSMRTELFKFEVPDMLDVFEENIHDKDMSRTQFPEFTAARGKAKALLGRFADALTDFDDSSKMDQNNAQTYFEKSTANRIMGNYEQALTDIEICATLKLDSNVAYNKAIIQENSGKIDESLELYESILNGIFDDTFPPEYLKMLKEKNMNVIDTVMRDETRKEKVIVSQKKKQIVVYPHLNSLYHAALLHRQKMNFSRALDLISVAIQQDNNDERFYDLQAMLFFDSACYDDAITSANKSIEYQLNHSADVRWESYYIRAIAFMHLQKYNSALQDLIVANSRPAGGQEKYMKRSEYDKVIGILLKLPPGSPLAIAYQNANNIDAIPKDPIAPSSAARGIDGDQNVFPLLDLSGSLPGFHNQYVILKKAECLFELKDYIGCVRAISIALEDYNYDLVKDGQREVNNLFNLVRSNKIIRMEGKNVTDQLVTDQAINFMQENIKVNITKRERDNIFQLYFLRGRALSMLNRFPHAIKDCQRAHNVYTQNMDSDAKANCVGVGSLLFFLAKLYAYLRMYTKSYHCARDSLKSGIPYNYIHRAHYLQGVALVYTNRLELAIKCFSLALRSHFQALVSEYIFEHTEQRGLIQLYSMEQIAAFLEGNPKSIKELNLTLIEKELQGTVKKTEAEAPINNDIHRLQVPKCFPTEQELISNKKLEAQRLSIIERAFQDSALNQLEFDTEPLTKFVCMSNKEEKQTLLQKISTPITWTTMNTVFYLHERAKCFQQMGMNQMAADDFTVVLKFQPNNDRAYFRRGFSLKQLGLFEQAVADFEQARKLRPDLQEYQVGYSEMGKLEYIELIPPGNEEFYEQGLVVPRTGKLSQYYSDLHQDVALAVHKRDTYDEKKDGIKGLSDEDVWAVVADFGPGLDNNDE
ncbi:Tetratricopeptide_repeat protein [Hexamita inflata]|uniref:Tetratricopeptide repeat protein n=1 Tax=Hexamita inflata TaxID=28002 RepID=A0AA86Q9V0_9EUKA|nr:Tetratricopeptide repeat protein [Hexamita inflata]